MSNNYFCVYEITGVEDRNHILAQLSNRRRLYAETAGSEILRSERIFSSALVEGLLKKAGYRGTYDYACSERGKPYLTDGDLYFSISHSYPFVAAAVSEQPVGIDIEKLDESRRKGWKEIAQSRYGSPKGKAWAELGDFAAFLSYFTRAEAYSKMQDIPLAGLLADDSWEDEAERFLDSAIGPSYIVSFSGCALKECSPQAFVS